MPRTTVYIRKDDWTKWQSTKNKAELIHDALNNIGIIAAVRVDYSENVPVRAAKKPAKIEHKTFFKDKKLNK